MAKFAVTTVKKDEVKVEPQLPKATVSADVVELNGVQGISVTTFYPLPEDDQLIVNERKGRKDDNKDKIVGVLTIIGRATKVALTMQQGNEEVALVDGNGNQLLHTSRLITQIKGEGAEDEGDED